MKKLLLSLIVLSCAGSVQAMDQLPELNDILQECTEWTLKQTAQLALLLNNEVMNLCDANIALLNNVNDTEINALPINIAGIQINNEKIEVINTQLTIIMGILGKFTYAQNTIAANQARLNPQQPLIDLDDLLPAYQKMKDTYPDLVIDQNVFTAAYRMLKKAPDQLIDSDLIIAVYQNMKQAAAEQEDK